MTKMHLVSGGKPLTPGPGLCPWTPLGALPPDPRYRLVLRTRHGAPPTTDPFRRLCPLRPAPARTAPHEMYESSGRREQWTRTKRGAGEWRTADGCGAAGRCRRGGGHVSDINVTYGVDVTTSCLDVRQINVVCPRSRRGQPAVPPGAPCSSRIHAHTHPGVIR